METKGVFGFALEIMPTLEKHAIFSQRNEYRWALGTNWHIICMRETILDDFKC